MKLFLSSLFLLSNTITPSLANSINVVNNQRSTLDLKEYNLNFLAKNIKGTKKKIKLHTHKDVGYVSVKEFLDSIEPLIKRNDVTHEFKDNKTTISLKSSSFSNLKVEFDYKTKDIIVSDNNIFTEILKDKERGEEKLNLEFKGIKNENPIKQFKYHLGDYNIEMLKDQNDIYLPIVLLNQIFLNESNIQVYFNQQDVNVFRFAESLSDFSGIVNLKYSKANMQNSISKELKEFQYKYIGFLLDNYYGIKLKNLTSYKTILSKYESWILSNSNDKHYLATKQLIADLDDPHSAFIMDGYFNKGMEYTKTKIESKSKEHREKIWNEMLHLLAKFDPNKIEYQNNFISSDASIISFKKFEESTASHIKKSLEEAQTKGIKNIIFNVTQNGGGFIGAAYEIMGFLTDKPFKVYNYNPLSKEQKVETIKSKYNKFDFKYYILTSPYSFSAGNIFPQIARDNKVAKLIGYKTFGGASSIGYFILPTGDIIQLSTNNVFTSSKFKSLEFGVNPDVKLDGDVLNNAKNLYDNNKLLDLISKADKIPFGNDTESTIKPSETLPIKPDNNSQPNSKPKFFLSKHIKNKNLKISKNDPITLLVELFETNPELKFDQDIRISLKDKNKAEIYLENNPEDKVIINFSVINNDQKQIKTNNKTKLIIGLVSSSIIVFIVLISAFFIIKKRRQNKK
ncbi:peptidase, S41 family [synthetic Mycoplasma mycoides JCVI-syn1.0]|uniref:S41 family peptidase n=1 Tax=Mycoplasma mycoides TaxID=2102 RepID=UPI0001793D6E|nr:S41 family peptidase [Mycoplasma mycoides]ADH21595.1 peptidase, S41 family [synthetic Mycoplasma mycoides JCVI-syn1.0]ACU78758.1 peptidase, S41 family [Mycoplasma mycoides subsp. capri str. GM12]ACU79589.1 peptidase, S41 family [Mycoplasma mycoides subsp. capri str. GM12]SRX58658.1 peptidase S41 [Mycoplasma mycoides subsp. capri]SRX61223.1 peptidase S41 [Mycoplasma mycoides subsp. capri]